MIALARSPCRPAREAPPDEEHDGERDEAEPPRAHERRPPRAGAAGPSTTAKYRGRPRRRDLRGEPVPRDRQRRDSTASTRSSARRRDRRGARGRRDHERDERRIAAEHRSRREKSSWKLGFVDHGAPVCFACVEQRRQPRRVEERDTECDESERAQVLSSVERASRPRARDRRTAPSCARTTISASVGTAAIAHPRRSRSTPFTYARTASSERKPSNAYIRVSCP